MENSGEKRVLKKVYEKKEIEAIGADFFKLLKKHYKNMDVLDMSCIMAYTSAFVLNSNTPDKHLITVGKMAYSYLTWDGKEEDAPVSNTKETEGVLPSNPEDSIPTGSEQV